MSSYLAAEAQLTQAERVQIMLSDWPSWAVERMQESVRHELNTSRARQRHDAAESLRTLLMTIESLTREDTSS